MRIEITYTKDLQLVLAIVGMLAFAGAPAAPKDFDLHQAVLDNDLQLARKFLSTGAYVNLIGSRKYGYGSPLHLAVREGHLDMAKLLLDRGADVDVLDPDDFTPLHNAAWNGNLEMVKLLMGAGADIEASTYDGDTPLSLAQNNDQAQAAEFLQAKLQDSSGVDTKVESTAASDSTVIDITGTYVSSELTIHGHPGAGPQIGKIILLIEQNGNTITGTDSSGEADIRGTRTGDTIKIEFWAPFWSYGAFAEWKVNVDGTQLEGSWKDRHTGYGKWNLTKIEAEPAQVVDISGTYINTELTYPRLVPRRYHSSFFGDGSNLKITIKQSGNAITGVISGENPGEFKGVIKGREITIESSMHAASNTFISGEGTWLVNNDGDALTGSYRLYRTSFGNTLGKWNYGDLIGNWNFRKIEAAPAQVVDVSGTYEATELTYPGNISRSYRRFYLGDGKNLKLTFEQDGDVVSGVISGDSTGEFKGKITGNEITFDFDLVSQGGSSIYGSSTLLVTDNLAELNGTITLRSTAVGNLTSQLKFRRIDGPAN